MEITAKSLQSLATATSIDLDQKGQLTIGHGVGAEDEQIAAALDAFLDSVEDLQYDEEQWENRGFVEIDVDENMDKVMEKIETLRATLLSVYGESPSSSPSSYDESPSIPFPCDESPDSSQLLAAMLSLLERAQKGDLSAQDEARSLVFQAVTADLEEEEKELFNAVHAQVVAAATPLYAPLEAAAAATPTTGHPTLFELPVPAENLEEQCKELLLLLTENQDADTPSPRLLAYLRAFVTEKKDLEALFKAIEEQLTAMKDPSTLRTLQSSCSFVMEIKDRVAYCAALQKALSRLSDTLPVLLPHYEGIKTLRSRLEEQQEIVEHALAGGIKNSYQLQESASDGNCLCDSIRIALEVYGQSYTTEYIRSVIVQEMRIHPERYKPLLEQGELYGGPSGSYLVDPESEMLALTYEDYLLHIAQDKAWLSRPELVALTHLIKRPLLVTGNRGEVFRILSIEGKEYLESGEPLLLFNDRERHYLPLVRKSTSD